MIRFQALQAGVDGFANVFWLIAENTFSTLHLDAKLRR